MLALELSKAMLFVQEWNRLNSAGNLSTGWLTENGERVNQALNAFADFYNRVDKLVNGDPREGDH